jgi:hypothetical protein
MMKGMDDNEAPRAPADEPEPDLDELTAMFDAGEPAELTRSPRQIEVKYDFVGRRWLASAPQITGFHVSASSLREAQRMADAGLRSYLDPSVSLVEVFVENQATAGAARSRVSEAETLLTSSTTSSGSRWSFSSLVGLVTA